jgi:hypothetical protein
MYPNTPLITPPTEPTSTPHAARKTPILLWITLGLLVILGGLGVYGFLDASRRTDALVSKMSKVEQTQGQLNEKIIALTEEKKAEEAKKTQVSGSNVDPMIPVKEMVSHMLTYIKTVRDQTGEYPAELGVDGSKLLWRYNYNQMAAPAQNCPTDARYFSYSGHKNMTSGEIDSFDMYYCDGSSRVKKTQKDIL